jgi:hypothetical protein
MTYRTSQIPVVTEKKMRIVDIVQYQNPLSMLAVLQPVIYQPKDIGLGILPPKQLHCVGDLPVALLKPGGVAGIDPENPRFRFALVDLVCIFYRQLRFSVRQICYYLSEAARRLASTHGGRVSVGVEEVSESPRMGERIT